MDENAVLRRVCIEPALYTFGAPRTIAATLHEYERHLGHAAGLCGQKLQATLDELRDLLDPIEAPLVALTAGMARTLVATAAPGLATMSGASCSSVAPPVESAWRFFGWAKEQGYVGSNPFEQLLRGGGHDGAGMRADRRSLSSAARGWVA